MVNKQTYNFIYALLTLAFFAFGCGCGSIKAEKNTVQKPQPIEIESKYYHEQNQTATQTVSASSVLGTYDYDTETDGEGYDNSLEVTRAADGKLFVYISGSYIYKIGETQSFKEAEGRGEAVLLGNRAVATLVDEAGKACRATITFQDATADVKIPAACRFNIRLGGGVYRKVNSKSPPTEKAENENLPPVGYAKTMDFVNDFEAHKVGEEFVITDVPSEILDQKSPADEFGNSSYKNLYYLQGVTDDDTPSYAVLTSKAMIESLHKNAEREPVILRLTAIIVESKGKFDVYRMPFATKIEGFNSAGDVIWTAFGAKPARLNYTH